MSGMNLTMQDFEAVFEALDIWKVIGFTGNSTGRDRVSRGGGQATLGRVHPRESGSDR